MSKMLDAVNSTALTRTTVHQQYNQRAFGLFMLGKLVPITLHIKTPGPAYKNAFLMFGENLHVDSPYKDLGIEQVCCKQVYNFNINHYVKHYLPSAIGEDGHITTPYTFNHCNVCGASIQDSNGHSISFIMKREYRKNKFIWATDEALQDDAGEDHIFIYQNEVTS